MKDSASITRPDALKAFQKVIRKSKVESVTEVKSRNHKSIYISREEIKKKTNFVDTPELQRAGFTDDTLRCRLNAASVGVYLFGVWVL